MLDGAMALAIPTRKGQSLEVSESRKAGIHWKSFDHENNCWFETVLHPDTPYPTQANETEKILFAILSEAKTINPLFLTEFQGYTVTTHLDFPKDWGLGSSSTLINNIAQWAQIDAFKLLHRSFGGSGYDIAAAQHDSAILYTKTKDTAEVREVALPWDFTGSLYFIHLNKKQDSKKGIALYKNSRVTTSQLETISDLSKKLLLCYSLADFEKIIMAHERIISEITGLPTVKDLLFNTYPGVIKSLGAWGGDFILATGNETTKAYFNEKGYPTCIPFAEMMR